MIVRMIDLFAGRAIVGTRAGVDYEFVADGRVVAATRSRPVAATHWWSWVGRLLGSSSATRRYEIEVLDPSDVPRWLITLSPGSPNTYAAEVTLVDGTPVGRVSADGGTFNPFPKIELTAADGTVVGHGTSKGAPQFFDAADRPLTEFTWQGAERPFDKPRWRLSFLDATLDAELRALVVAGIIAWELPR